MPEFAPSQVHVNQPLSNISLQYKNYEYIAEKVLPWIDVDKRSNVYFVYTRDDTFRISDDRAAPRAKINNIQFNITTQNYSVKDYALSDLVPKETMDNADAPLDPLIDTTEHITDQLLLAHEARVAGVVFNSANYFAGLTKTYASLRWSDKVNGTPLDDLLLAIDQPAVRPNTFVLGRDVWRFLRSHPQIVGSCFPLGGNSAKGGVASLEALAQILDIDQVIVGRAVFTGAAQPLAGATPLSPVWGNFASLLYVNPNPGIRQITYGASFVETRPTTRTWDENSAGPKGSTAIATNWAADNQVIAKDVGYLFVTPI